MVACLQQHVPKGIPHFARRLQHATMVAIRQHRPNALEDPVHRPREARADGLHATRRGVTVGRFDEQVHVIRLQRVVHHPEVSTLRGVAEAVLEDANERGGTERRDVRAHAKRHVCGVAGGKRRACGVTNAGPIARGLPAGAGAPPAPMGPSREGERELAGTSCHATSSRLEMAMLVERAGAVLAGSARAGGRSTDIPDASGSRHPRRA